MLTLNTDYAKNSRMFVENGTISHKYILPKSLWYHWVVSLRVNLQLIFRGRKATPDLKILAYVCAHRMLKG